MSAPTTITRAFGLPEDLPTDLLGDTLAEQGLVEALNELLAATEEAEQRLPMALNRFGQWCTKGIGGWRPHRTYMDAYYAAHAEEVS